MYSAHHMEYVLYIEADGIVLISWPAWLVATVMYCSVISAWYFMLPTGTTHTQHSSILNKS